MRLKTDEVLFVAGDPGDGCYRVLDGLLKVVMTSDSNERILAFLGLGAIVGELSVIDRLPRSTSVTAVRPAILSFVSDADFREFGKEHPQVYEALVALLAARLRETDTTIATGTFLPLHGRVACALLELAQKYRTGQSWLIIRNSVLFLAASSFRTIGLREMRYDRRRG